MYQSWRRFHSGVRQSGGGFIVTATPPPSFPVNGIIDNFNRANEGPPLSTSWSNSVVVGDSGYQVVTNKARGATGTVCSTWWNVSTFGPNCEAYLTIAATAGSFEGVFLRLATPGTAGVDGYLVQSDKDAGTVAAFRVDNGAFTQLGTTISQAITAGDGLGASIVGSTITVYYKVGAGAWNSVGTRSDSTYSAAGFIGMRCGNTSPIDQDDFGGGTI